MQKTLQLAQKNHYFHKNQVLLHIFEGFLTYLYQPPILMGGGWSYHMTPLGGDAQILGLAAGLLYNLSQVFQ